MAKHGQQWLQEMKGKLDVELLGVASVETSGSKELKERAASLLPGVKSVVAFGKETYKEVIDLLKPSKEVGEAAYGDLYEPHIEYINGRLTRAVYELANIFRNDGYQSLPLPARGCPFDTRFLTAIFSYRHAAELAGLGILGRHSLLITPEYGSRVRLACLLTEAPLESSSLKNEDYCTSCNACIRECPANALQVPGGDEAYSINKYACRAYRQAGLTCSMCIKACDEVLG
ncbi:MAG: epoxyqueuosine reductase [Deltaproteobacteria bacterium]|nr:epoxyqueuosine reductase [Deltaproteobacteria bacterium]